MPARSSTRTIPSPTAGGVAMNAAIRILAVMILTITLATPIAQGQINGWWDEMGWRSGSGSGVSYDEHSTPTDGQLTLTSSGVPTVFWVEDDHNDYDYFQKYKTSSPVPFHWEVSGDIYARQYGGESLGWVNIWAGSGDDGDPVGYGSQIAVAAGPDGQMGIAWVGSSSEINVRLWNGNRWLDASELEWASGDNYSITQDSANNEKPDIVMTPAGEVYVSYAAMHPATMQREIVVKKLPSLAGSQWIEIISTDRNTFGIDSTSGVSNDLSSSFDSAITLDVEGRPIVAWTNRASGNQYDIFVRRWDGQDWVELGVGSATDPDNNGSAGISNDPEVSLEPDIILAPNGDVIVAWVSWANWAYYAANGQASIHVRKLVGASATGTWTAYATGSDTGTGICGSNAAGEPGYGWYYAPVMAVTSDNHLAVTWQGYSGISFTNGATERMLLDLDLDPDPTDDEDVVDDSVRETPMMAVYSRYYNGTAFEWLTLDMPAEQYTNTIQPLVGGVNNERYTASDTGHFAWMPSVLIDQEDNILLSYTWADITFNNDGEPAGGPNDDELFVQVWDNDNNNWDTYGRGSNTSGNDVFSGWGLGGTTRIALIDYDNDPSTSEDLIFTRSGEQRVYLYNRTTGIWTAPAALNTVAFSHIYDLRGEPEIENNLDGDPLLAYLDSATGLPYVYRWSDNAWELVGGTAASAAAGIWDISVQAGPQNQILVVYNDLADPSFVRCYLWNGTTWAAVGSTALTTGMLPKGGNRQVFFYSDFDEETFDDFEFVDEPEAGGAADPEQWYVSPDPVWHNLTTASVDEAAGQDVTVDVDGNVVTSDNGLRMEIEDVEPVIPDPGEPQSTPATGDVLTASFTYTFALLQPADVVIHYAYSILNPITSGRITLTVALDGTTVFNTTGASAYTANTHDTEALAIPTLAAGEHTLTFTGTLTISGDAEPDPVPDGYTRIANFQIDNVIVYAQLEGSGTGTTAWDKIDRTDPTSVGGNGVIIPNLSDPSIEDPCTYDFGSAVRVNLGGAGQQRITIPDIDHQEDGPFYVNFRYAMSGTGVEIHILINTVDYYSETGTVDWADSTAHTFNWISLEIPDLAEGVYSVHIVLIATGAADLWVDNLSVLNAMQTYSVDPIATLAPSGNSEDREFAIAATNYVPSLKIYNDQDMEGLPDGEIDTRPSPNGYVSGAIYTLSEDMTTWNRYGDELMDTANIDFLFSSQNISKLHLPYEYLFAMPSDDLYVVSDVAVGPDAMMWVAMQHYSTQFLSSENKFYGSIDDVRVWRWDPFNTDADIYTFEKWVDTALPQSGFDAYTGGQLINSAGETMIAAWNNRPLGPAAQDIDGIQYYTLMIHSADARQYISDGNWQGLGTGDGSIQNGTGWSAAHLDDMVGRTDGYPVVTYRMGHMDCDAVREFVPDRLQAEIVITENSGTANDNILEFPTDQDTMTDRAFSIKNNGDADLVLFGLTIETGATYGSDFFTLRNITDADFPITIAPERSYNFAVRFDPDGLEPGYYNAVLQIHSNANNNHFIPIGLNASISGATTTGVYPTAINFGQGTIVTTTIDQLTDAQIAALPSATVMIWNGNDDPEIDGETMDVYEWFFEGNNFFIPENPTTWTDPCELSAYITSTNPVTGQYVYTPVDNMIDLGDDPLVLTDEAWLTLRIVFAPEATEQYLDKFFVHTDDTETPYSTVSLTGVGVSGARLQVQRADGTVVPDGTGVVDFGRLVVNQTSDVIALTLKNTGVSDLTISSVFETNLLMSLTIQPAVPSEGWTLAPGASRDIELTYSPTQAEQLDTTLLITSNSADTDEMLYEISLIGTAVDAQTPQLGFTEIAQPNLSRTWFYEDLYDPADSVAGQADPDSGTTGTDDDALRLTIDASGYSGPSGSDLAGLFTHTFTMPMDGTLQVSFQYRQTLAGTLPAQSAIALQLRVDDNDQLLEEHFTLTSTGNAADSGWQTLNVTIADLAAGEHTLDVIGSFSGPSAAPSGNAEMFIDDVVLQYPTTSIDFGQTQADAAVVRQFSIDNIGGVDITLESYRMASASETAFTISPTNPEGDTGDVDLAALTGREVITATFLPTSSGLFAQYVQVHYRNAVGNLAYIELQMTGSAVAALLTIEDSVAPYDDAQIDFGPTPRAEAAESQTITLRNDGSADLVVTDWALTDAAGAFSLTAFTEAVTLAPGQTQTLTVGFTPPAAGTYEATVSITDFDNLTRTVSLAGQGIDTGDIVIGDPDGTLIDPNNPGALPVVDFTPVTPLASGSSETAVHTFTIQNASASVLRIKAVRSGSEFFVVDPSVTLESDADDILLDPGEEFDFTITFHAPSRQFMGTATLTVITNTEPSVSDDRETYFLLEAEAVRAARIGDTASSQKTQWTNSQGDTININLSGPGSATVYAAGGDELDQSIDRIVLVGTTEKSMLKITSKEQVTIGGISAGAMGSMILNNVIIGSNGITCDSLDKQLSFDTLSEGAAVTINGVSGNALNIQVDTLSDNTTVYVNGPIGTCKVDRLDTCAISAESIKTLTVKDERFNATIALTGTLQTIKAKKATFSGLLRVSELGKATFASLDQGMISAEQWIGSVKASGMTDSAIVAGYDPETGALYENSEIKTVNIKGTFRDSYVAAGIRPSSSGGTFGNFLEPISTAAGSINKVTVKAVGGDGVEDFGVIAHGSIGTVKVGRTKMTIDQSDGNAFVSF